MVDEWEKETEREEKGWNSSPVDVMFMTLKDIFDVLTNTDTQWK